MKVESLNIEIPSYGDSVGRYIGTVALKGTYGKQVIALSSGAIGRIFEVIRQEVSATAKFNAKQTDKALEEAANSTTLLGVVVDDTPL